MTTDEMIEILEHMFDKREGFTAVRAGENTLGVEDPHGERHFVVVEEV